MQHKKEENTFDEKILFKHVEIHLSIFCTFSESLSSMIFIIDGIRERSVVQLCFPLHLMGEKPIYQHITLSAKRRG